MTMIIVKGLEKETFSILSFYKARVRRIIPALAVLCFVLMFLGLSLLSPIDYLNLGKHSAASLTFLSNMVIGLNPITLTLHLMKNGFCILGAFPLNGSFILFTQSL